MMGDQRQVGHTVRGPKFMRLLGTEEEQVETFGGKAYADTRELDEVIEELEHRNNGATVVEPDNALDPAVTWRMLILARDAGAGCGQASTGCNRRKRMICSC